MHLVWPAACEAEGNGGVGSRLSCVSSMDRPLTCRQRCSVNTQAGDRIDRFPRIERLITQNFQMRVRNEETRRARAQITISVCSKTAGSRWSSMGVTARPHCLRIRTLGVAYAPNRMGALLPASPCLECKPRVKVTVDAATSELWLLVVKRHPPIVPCSRPMVRSGTLASLDVDTPVLPPPISGNCSSQL